MPVLKDLVTSRFTSGKNEVLQSSNVIKLILDI